jgi:DNA mismatch repair protein MutL
MRINYLDADTINRIAAGEVIARPASIVKELVENAIDAGSRRITVTADEGGLTSLSVSDDGEGMTAEELVVAVERHTTSKIGPGADLVNIFTLGFRGEALASIAAVSQLEITSRPPEALAGARLRVRGGRQESLEPAACPPGTTMVVRDLFFNTPARKKFLKRPATELSAITDVLQQIAFTRPEIKFSFNHNGRQLLSTPGNGSLRDTAASLLGLETAEALLECQGTRAGYSLRGFIANPSVHRSSRSYQFFSVNGRPISNRMMASALEKAFSTLLPVQRYPIAVLNLEVPAQTVDVNVHPAKQEVKFSDSDTIFRLVYFSCLDALSGGIVREAETVISPQTPESLPQSATDVATEKEVDGAEFPRIQPRPQWTAAKVRETKPQGSSIQETLFRQWPAGPAQGRTTVLGQVLATYLVVETHRGLMLVDQHAAQERILYERYLGLLRSGQVPSQAVLPLRVSAGPSLLSKIQERLPELANLGFKLEIIQDGFILKEAPILFKKALGAGDMLAMVEGLLGGDNPDFSLGDYHQVTLHMMACKDALKANQTLSPTEAARLLTDLEACQNSATCPHGRPISVTLDRSALEKMFARR